MGDNEKEILDENVAVSTKVSADDVSMEDLNNQTAKAAVQRKSGKKSDGFWASLKGEFKKIIWPSGQTLVKETATVIVASVVLGVVIAVLDIVIRLGLEQIVTK